MWTLPASLASTTSATSTTCRLFLSSRVFTPSSRSLLDSAAECLTRSTSTPGASSPTLSTRPLRRSSSPSAESTPAFTTLTSVCSRRSSTLPSQRTSSSSPPGSSPPTSKRTPSALMLLPMNRLGQSFAKLTVFLSPEASETEVLRAKSLQQNTPEKAACLCSEFALECKSWLLSLRATFLAGPTLPQMRLTRRPRRRLSSRCSSTTRDKWEVLCVSVAAVPTFTLSPRRLHSPRVLQASSMRVWTMSWRDTATDTR
mmetsp:Transcript_385/g.877  ORF Transcript_385/g.877 Transcript_385/m.877 type:complete len:257 (-) Transcript_385:948-1718(-)